MSYREKKILREKTGNNAFAWDERMRKYGISPTLTLPPLIDGGIDDVIEGDDIVFEEMEDGVLRSCRGLRNFVRLRGIGAKNGESEGATLSEGGGKQGEDERQQSESEFVDPSGAFGTFTPQGGTGQSGKVLTSSFPEIIIFDNHNHALYFWIDAVRRGIIEPGFELIHIDEHSDLWANEHILDLERALRDEEYAWQFTNLECNVGNYIVPARSSGLVGEMIRIENEYQIDEYMEYIPSENSVLNLDLDIFAPELDHISEEKKIELIKHLLKKVKYVTIATSPYFIEQGLALNQLKKLFLN